jgi:serine/threonine protein kinase
VNPGERPDLANPTRTDAPGAAGLDPAAIAFDGPRPAPEVPRDIGPYRLLHCIGEGGMGQVWLANQLQPVRRQVAVKVIKAGMDSRQVVARFESERQALALMNHRAIARVFDGGTTPEGRPYFVMEYVAGINIADHCDTHQLSTAARLELLCEVCAGVQHAHQKAVIHRDLKPSNILVALADGKAQPKIIDFGVAKATGQQLTDKTLQTAIGAVVGTLEYMSPEQADPTAQGIDTRTDVYSLGVILYELLTGELPFWNPQRSQFSQDELRRLREAAPPRPSARVSGAGARTAEVARNRSTEPLALRSLLKGDLDAISLKALETDRSRRYDTPSELAADLQRYLRHEPVLAQPPSAAYRARKYVQRNRALVASAAAVFAALLAGVIVSAWQAQRARQAERRATSEAAVAKAISDFLENDVLGQADVARQSGGKPDPELKVRTALDRAAARIDGKFAGKPAVEASVRGTIGDAYKGLGLYPEAHQQLERALEVSRKALGPEHPDTLRAAANFAALALQEGRYKDSEALFEQTLLLQQRVLGPEHIDTVRSVVGLATARYALGKRVEVEAGFLQALGLQQRILGPEHRETLQTMRKLANTYAVDNKPLLAEPLYRQVVEAERRSLGPEHPDTLLTLTNQAAFFLNFERAADAAAVLSEILPVQRRVLGPEHPGTIQSLEQLARARWLQARYPEAEARGLEALELKRRVLGPEHPTTLFCRLMLGSIDLEWGRYAQAEGILLPLVEVMRRVLGPEALFTLDAIEALAKVYAAEGRLAEAAALAGQNLAVRRRTQGAEHLDTLLVATSAASIASLQGKFAEAEGLLEGLLEPLRRVVGPEALLTLRARAELARTVCRKGSGNYGRAEALFAETLALERRVLGAEHVETLQTLDASGTCFYLDAKYGEAAALLEEALAGRRRVLGATHPATLDTMVNLALVQLARGNFAAGAALAREASAGDQKTRPEAWQRFFSASVLGANLLAGHEASAAQPLLASGLHGMELREALIPVPERFRLDRAREWLAQAHAR